MVADVMAVDAACAAWRGKGDTTARAALDAYLAAPLDPRAARAEAAWNPWMYEPDTDQMEG